MVTVLGRQCGGGGRSDGQDRGEGVRGPGQQAASPWGERMVFSVVTVIARHRPRARGCMSRGDWAASWVGIGGAHGVGEESVTMRNAGRVSCDALGHGIGGHLVVASVAYPAVPQRRLRSRIVPAGGEPALETSAADMTTRRPPVVAAARSPRVSDGFGAVVGIAPVMSKSRECQECRLDTASIPAYTAHIWTYGILDTESYLGRIIRRAPRGGPRDERRYISGDGITRRRRV